MTQSAESTGKPHGNKGKKRPLKETQPERLHRQLQELALNAVIHKIPDELLPAHLCLQPVDSIATAKKRADKTGQEETEIGISALIFDGVVSGPQLKIIGDAYTLFEETVERYASRKVRVFPLVKEVWAGPVPQKRYLVYCAVVKNPRGVRKGKMAKEYLSILKALGLNRKREFIKS